LGPKPYLQGWPHLHILVINSPPVDPFICDYRPYDVTINRFLNQGTKSLLEKASKIAFRKSEQNRF
jgi:hypothetical protein